jgi:hypothetical protein
MERRRAIAWAGSISLTACVSALALGSFVGGFGFDAPQSPTAPHSPQAAQPQVPEPQVPEQPAGPELMPEVPQERPSPDNAHKALLSDSAPAPAPTVVPAPVAVPHVDNYPRVLAGHQKAPANLPIPPRDARPARDVDKPANPPGAGKAAPDVALRDAWMDVLNKDGRFSWKRDILAVFRDSKRSSARSAGARNDAAVSERLTRAGTHAGTADHQAGGQTDGHDD